MVYNVHRGIAFGCIPANSRHFNVIYNMNGAGPSGITPANSRHFDVIYNLNYTFVSR